MNNVNLSYYRFWYVRYLDICRYIRYLSDICRYLSDIGHIWNLGSFTKAILLQKCSISLICPDIAIRSRSSRSDWLHQMYRRTHEHEKFEASYTKSPFGAIKSKTQGTDMFQLYLIKFKIFSDFSDFTKFRKFRKFSGFKNAFDYLFRTYHSNNAS